VPRSSCFTESMTNHTRRSGGRHSRRYGGISTLWSRSHGKKFWGTGYLRRLDRSSLSNRGSIREPLRRISRQALSTPARPTRSQRPHRHWHQRPYEEAWYQEPAVSTTAELTISRLSGSWSPKNSYPPGFRQVPTDRRSCKNRSLRFITPDGSSPPAGAYW
jgi:hypothetical protein